MASVLHFIERGSIALFYILGEVEPRELKVNSMLKRLGQISSVEILVKAKVKLTWAALFLIPFTLAGKFMWLPSASWSIVIYIYLAFFIMNELFRTVISYAMPKRIGGILNFVMTLC